MVPEQEKGRECVFVCVGSGSAVPARELEMSKLKKVLVGLFTFSSFGC